jgi:hypothetical protein
MMRKPTRKKALLCSLAGTISVGALSLLGIELLVSLTISLFVMVVIATMVLTDDPRDKESGYTDGEGGDAINARSSQGHTD